MCYARAIIHTQRASSSHQAQRGTASEPQPATASQPHAQRGIAATRHSEAASATESAVEKSQTSGIDGAKSLKTKEKQAPGRAGRQQRRQQTEAKSLINNRIKKDLTNHIMRRNLCFIGSALNRPTI